MNSIVNEFTTQRQVGEGGPTNPASPSDVVAALRRHEWVRIMQEAANLIEQQAERIKELEAERDAERDNCVAVIATYQEQLSALRQRIDDAPVVAWLHEVRRDSDVITDQVKHLWGRVPVAVGKEARYTIPLISKGDLL